jgi:hypothetical protein
LQDKGTYELGKDTITSIKGVIGDLGARKVTGISTATENGVQTKVYSYSTDPDDGTQAANDIAAYWNYISENDGFLSLVSFDGLPYEGGVELRFAKESVDGGKIIIMDIDYNAKGYTVTITKGEGTLTGTD